MTEEPVDDLEDDEDYPPPPLERVRDRAWVLSCVVARAFAETFDDRAEAATLQSRILTWIHDVGFDDEFEYEEREMVEADLGSLDQQTVVNGTWRSESLAVLAWALGRYEVPAHDELADPSGVAHSVGFLAENARDEASDLELRSEEEIAARGAVLLGLHWRVRDFTIRPEAMDFAEFARDSWFGGFPLEGIALADGDLSIDGVPIADAPQESFDRCQSIAVERHQAVNWLQGCNPVFSEVDTST